MKKLLLILAISGFLAACSSTPKKESGAAAGEGGTATTSQQGAQSYGTGTRSTSAMEELNDPQSPLAIRVIYFEYDSSEIRPEFQQVIEAHANFLAANPSVTVSIEGHADERGSREYNLALGERRAQAVKRQMQLLGATASQMHTVSYGEERPAVEGHDEKAWSQNRRVELIY